MAAVITNLADEALAGGPDAGCAGGGDESSDNSFCVPRVCVSVAAYQATSRAIANPPTLPTLFIIVDEFSELLSRHPEFAELFVAIGRLGRSLGMHLLLASQRLDEGTMRGLETHLSYRVCLKTLSASESLAVLGCARRLSVAEHAGRGIASHRSGHLIRFGRFRVGGRPGETDHQVRATPSPAIHRRNLRGPGRFRRGIFVDGHAGGARPVGESGSSRAPGVVAAVDAPRRARRAGSRRAP